MALMKIQKLLMIAFTWKENSNGKKGKKRCLGHKWSWILILENKKSENENMETIMTTVFPIVILPFFMLTIFLVQMIGAEVNEEKTTKSMEIIISNVSPKTHFLSKILSSNLFVIIHYSTDALFIYLLKKCIQK